MKIVAGLGAIEEYPAYVNAGADELFCGYVPAGWNEKYGMKMPLNRREVRYYNVQIGSMEDLKILRKMIDRYGAPVKIALNSLYYTREQYAEIAKIVRECLSIGYDSFIIADPVLLKYLKEQRIMYNVHISGEMSEYNTSFLGMLGKYFPKRVIFHRKCDISDMAECISFGKAMTQNPIEEYEAFILNELCHFTGAYCNSLHCDEMCHLCHVPYEVGGIAEKRQAARLCQDISYSGELLGESGCGLCALWKLQKAGITHLKVVGRGNYPDEMERDIRGLRKALQLLEDSTDEADFHEKIRNTLFPEGCSGKCYYILPNRIWMERN